MLHDIEIGKVLRKSVKDQNGRLVNKIFRVTEIITEGQDWKVATVIDEATMNKCTLKVLSKTDKMCKARIVSEIKNQKKMSGRHNFVSLQQVYEDNTAIYLLMDLWGVSLQKILARRHTLMEREVQLVFCQLVDILENLRAANISHGNITLSSVLLLPGQANVLQLTQFSQSHDISLNQPSTEKANLKKAVAMSRSKTKWAPQKSVSNIAEEQVEGARIMRSGQRDVNEYTSPQQYLDEKITYDRDIWSTGVLLYKLLTGIFPFSDEADKLVIKKIINATFSFPTLQQTRPLQGSTEPNLRKIGHLQFLSSEWKELLKKMMADRNLRINLQQLINHPLKQAYFSLKDIRDLNTAQPSLINLFSAKADHNNTFKKTWNINFQDEEEDEKEFNSNMTYEDLVINPPEKYQQDQPEEKRICRQSIRGATELEYKPEKQNHPRKKDFRVHKTQFGMPIANSIKSINQNQRHETVDHFRQRRKREKQDSVITPISQPTQRSSPPMPLVVKDPPFIVKFHYFKKLQWLGYVLNNAIGIIYADGEHVVGHNREDFRYIQDESVINSELMINEAEAANLPPQTIKQSIYKNHPRFATFNKSIEGEYSFKPQKNKNCQSEQVSTKDFHENNPSNFQFNPTKTIITNSCLTGDKGLLSLGKQKATIYLKAIDYFGERVVKDTLDVWVDQFWQDGNIYVFLLNTGCWQVAFREQKHFRIYAIDQYDLTWSRDHSSNDLTQSLRQLVKRYQPLAKNKRNTSQP